MIKRIIIDIKATMRMFIRNKGAVFWTFAFPVLLILIFGAIFSGAGDATYTLYVQDLDDGIVSDQFIEALESTGVLKIKMIDINVNATSYINDNSVTSFLIIPEDFSERVTASDQSAYVELRQDQTAQSSNIVRSIVGAVVNDFNLKLSNGREFIVVEDAAIVQEDLNFIDYFLPGIIGLTVMTNCVFYMQGVQSRYYSTGIFRKLSTTPFTRLEWLVSRAIWQMVLMFMSVGLIIVVGMVFFDVRLTITVEAVLMIITGSMLFTGLGMMISRFSKDEESANAAASAITFPMMFLSGSFFALESMPGYLQIIAKVIPLTYLNNGLRDTMIYGNAESALFNLAILTVIAVVFMGIGSYISRWTED
ncbi:MAG: ABC transporter permease [Methanomassiliicoccales archaeon]|nr:MAG: ABC transporter permease [Methanomassiliicoccales archaeon]